MTTFALTLVMTLVIFALAALGLGLGVAFRRAPIQGSCGGAACLKKLGVACSGGCDKGDHDHD